MRSPSVVLLLISFLLAKHAHSQSEELLIQGQTGNLYLEHTVAAKENWYSIGRLYNISPKEVAPFNKLTMAEPLAIGQRLRIPLTAVNFSQSGLKSPAETLVPLYHIIQEKEWMYRVSLHHNKVPIASLEKWNNINKDQVKAGMHLIVGYLKVKTAPPVITATIAASSPASQENLPITKEEPKVVAHTNAPSTSAGSAAASKPTTTAPAAVSPATSSPGVSAPGVSTSSVSAPAASTTALHFNGGYFKTEFAESGKSVSGPAAIFKSTSGWQDGRYYALMNNVAVGTIVKINAASGKSIYAKVLGQLPDMKESAGLTVRISNAAASELGEGEEKFTVEVRY